MSKKEKALKTMNSNLNSFSRRHIGIDQKVSAEMLKDIGFSSMDDFIQSIVENEQKIIDTITNEADVKIVKE